MEISAQNPAAQAVNTYNVDKVVEKRDDERNSIKVKDTKEENKVEERKASSDIETKRKDDVPRKSETETESIDDAYAMDREEDALRKISVYA